MAEKKRALEILIAGRDNGTLGRALTRAQKGVNRYTAALGGLSRQQKSVGASAGMVGGVLKSVVGFAAAYVGTQQLVAGIKDTITAYQESYREESRLQKLAMNVKGTTQVQINALKSYASELQKVTTVEDDVTIRGQSQLSTFQLQAKSIKSLTPALQDLAVGTYGPKVGFDQMQQSANLLGKVFTGQVGALRRVGINFSKAQEEVLKMGNEQEKVAVLTQVISQNYGGLAKKMAQTPEGRILQLANAWGDVKEEIGGRLSPILIKLLNWLAPRLPAIQAAITKIIDTVFDLSKKLRPVWDIAYKIGNWVVKNWKLVVPVVAGIVVAVTAWKAAIAVLTLAQLALNLSMTANPIGLIITAIGVLIGLIGALVLNWDKVKAAMAKAWDWFVKFATNGPGRFIPIINIIGKIAENWDKVKNAIRSAWNWAVKIAKLLYKGSPLAMMINGGKWVAGKVSGKRAAGGPVSAGRSYLVGERGPEMFVPRSSGSIIPNLSLAGGMNITFAPQITIAGNADRREVHAGINAAFDDFKRNMSRYIREQKRRGF